MQAATQWQSYYWRPGLCVSRPLMTSSREDAVMPSKRMGSKAGIATGRGTPIALEEQLTLAELLATGRTQTVPSKHNRSALPFDAAPYVLAPTVG